MRIGCEAIGDGGEGECGDVRMVVVVKREEAWAEMVREIDGVCLWENEAKKGAWLWEVGDRNGAWGLAASWF